MEGPAATAANASPFLTRVVADWLRDAPERRWQVVGGALVFVDVSGFTAMSERLASLGREGAERVTEIIDGAFSELLADAYGQGGSLLKFGGDALLLLFEGEDAASRAAWSAHAMGRTLGRIGRIATPAGEVRLRMSAGVHAGPVHLFLVGRSHRELIVAGPGATAVVEAEGAAGPGKIVLSPGAAELLPSDAVGPPHGPGRFLAAPPTVPPARAIEPVEAAAQHWRGMSTALRRHLVDTRRERAEHRLGVVAFIHFRGTDRVVEDEGPETAAAALHELVSTVQAAVDKHDLCLLASDVDADGGKLIVSGGVPVAHDDDVDRVLLAMRAVADAGTRLPVQIGVHHGPLFAGEVGPAHRRTYTVMGDVVNTAARVMSKAGPYEVLVTDQTLERATVAFERSPVEPFAVKGKTEPLIASSIGATLTDGDRFDEAAHSSRVLVGRDDLVEQLLGRHDEARAGRGAVVELVGPAGVGKTELLRAVLAVRGTDHVVVVRGLRATSADAYGPMRAALLGALGVSSTAGPEEMAAALTTACRDAGVAARAADALAVAVGAASTPTSEVDPRDFRADVADAVDALIADGFPDGLMLVVENAQWLDEATAALVRDLARRAPDRPWLIALTTREPVKGLTGDRIAVEPLDMFHATELALVTSDSRLLPSQAKAIADRTGGNPLAIIELVPSVEAGRAIDDLPATLEAILAARIDRLAPGERATLRQLAVLGAVFESALARDFLGVCQDDLDKVLLTLDDVLTRWETQIRFRETLLHDAAYAGLSYRRRRELHGRAGLQLEAHLSDPLLRADELSTHFEQAGDADRTWRYSIAAGTAASDAAAFESAAIYLQRALRVAGRATDVTSRERGRVMQRLGRVETRLGRLSEAEATLRRAVALLDDPVDGASVLADAGQVAREQGRRLAAVRRFNSTLRALEGVPSGAERDSVQTTALLGLVSCRFAQGRLGEALHLAETARELAAAGGDALREARTLVWLINIGVTRAQPGVEELAHDAVVRMERLGRRRDVAHVRNALATYFCQIGRAELALEHFEAARDELERLGLSMEAAVARYNAADVLFDLGRLREASVEFGRVAAVFGAVGHPYGHAARAMGHVVEARTRDLAAARTGVEDSLAMLRAAGLDLAADEISGQWAEVLLDAGYRDEVVELIAQLAGTEQVSLQERLEHLRGRLELTTAN